jgi:hypothetical protein
VKVESHGVFSQEMLGSSGWPLDKFPDHCYTNDGVKGNSEVLRGSVGVVTTWLSSGSTSGLHCPPSMAPRLLSLCHSLFCPSELFGERHGLADTAELHGLEGCWSSHCQYDRESARWRNRADFRSCGGKP